MEYEVIKYYRTEFGDFSIGNIVQITTFNSFGGKGVFIGKLLNLSSDIITLDCSKEYDAHIKKIETCRIDFIERLIENESVILK